MKFNYFFKLFFNTNNEHAPILNELFEKDLYMKHQTILFQSPVRASHSFQTTNHTKTLLVLCCHADHWLTENTKTATTVILDNV